MKTWMEQSCGSQELCKPHLVGVRDSYQVRSTPPQPGHRSILCCSRAAMCYRSAVRRALC